jgi:hypothetical protein
MTTTEVRVLDDRGVDKGYLSQPQNWWFDPNFPHAFELFDLDAFYEAPYYEADHVGEDTVLAYVDAILQYGQRLNGRPVRSVLECGCAGGWFTEEFLKRGIDVIALEGSSAGIKRALSRGVPAERLKQHDLRRPIQLGRRFDVAICTEVAEHIECPFSSQLIQTLVTHSDVVWFSFEPPDTNEAHYHHSNEQPAKFWLNLFKFFDYRAIELPDSLGRLLDYRGTHIFCAPSVAIPEDVHVLPKVERSVANQFGRHSPVQTPKRDARYWIRKFSPPIAMDVARAVRRKLRESGMK